MNLSTTYLGLQLANPFMPGASPLVDDLDNVKRLEDAGASAIVMHSLFEEQLKGEQLANIYVMEAFSDAYAEALSYFPRAEEFKLTPNAYLQHLQAIKKAVKVPVIASLNGTTMSGWVEYARQMEQAGADALEVNVYYLPTDPQETGEAAEKRLLEIAPAVKRAITIPVAVKLSPFFSSLPNLTFQLETHGIDGLVVFNRFYQPDIDIENLEVVPRLKLSDSSELLLRLRWLAILARQSRMSLACSGGVHTAADAIKALMAGANAVQLVSALLMHGPGHLKTIIQGVHKWMEEHEYSSMRQMIGSMSLSRCPDPAAFERANYMRVLQSWRGVEAYNQQLSGMSVS